MQLDRPDISARYAAFTATQMTMLFIQSYPAQMLFDHSIRVSEYVWARYVVDSITLICSKSLIMQQIARRLCSCYRRGIVHFSNNSGWYLTSIRTRKLICLMTMRSRVPCILTAGKFYILNLANFSAVSKGLVYLCLLINPFPLLATFKTQCKYIWGLTEKKI